MNLRIKKIRLHPPVVSNISPMTMCLHVSADGSHYLGKNTHLSVHLYANEGQEEFNGNPQNKFDIKLLNHTDKEKHLIPQ